ncbi:MAG: sigma-54-dependent Fis family transcriptional regulator, partial [Candidatus Aminicenantes bacterium]|nr:sigma-54-dependent Fis family transcriptional regulator [Candidatus Aminicenantes bacterium]
MSETLEIKDNILLVDDEENILLSYEITLNSSGIDDIILDSDSRKVIPILNKRTVELVILDLTMPFISGEELLAKIKSEFPDIPVIIITGNLEIESAVRCMQGGALDYIVKPVDGDRLISSVKRALERNNLLRENKFLKTQLLSTELERPEIFSLFNSCSSKMFSIFKYAEAVSSSPEPILLTGETGVGKELMARTIHKLSNRTGDFVPVSIAG